MLKRLMQHLNRVDPFVLVAGPITASWVAVIMNLCATNAKINLGDTLDFCFIATLFLGLFCGLTHKKSAQLCVVYFSALLFTELTILALCGFFIGMPPKIMICAIIVVTLCGAVSVKIGTVVKDFFRTQFNP